MNIDPKLAKQHGIQLDQSGWPTESSLQDWHAKNNPQPKKGISLTYVIASAIGVITAALIIFNLP